jgi:hypothetical protein
MEQKKIHIEHDAWPNKIGHFLVQNATATASSSPQQLDNQSPEIQNCCCCY